MPVLENHIFTDIASALHDYLSIELPLVYKLSYVVSRKRLRAPSCRALVPD